MRALLLTLLLAGCAAAPDLDERDRSALARELGERVAGEPASCVTALQGDSLQAVDDRTIVYRNGGTIWVNRSEHSCPGLRPDVTLIVESHGTPYCRGDFVRTIEPGANIPGPICVLGDFVPYRRAR